MCSARAARATREESHVLAAGEEGSNMARRRERMLAGGREGRREVRCFQSARERCKASTRACRSTRVQEREGGGMVEGMGRGGRWREDGERG